MGSLLLIPEVTIPIPKKILNWHIKRKSCSKNKNEGFITTAFDYKSEIAHKVRFWLGLRLIAIGFLLQLIGAMAIGGFDM